MFKKFKGTKILKIGILDTLHGKYFKTIFHMQEKMLVPK